MTGGSFVLGAAGTRDDIARPVAKILEAAGFAAFITQDIRREIWTKLINNASCNPLSVVAHATVEQMVINPDLRRVLRTVMTEVADVAAAVGAPVSVSLDERLNMNEKLGAVSTSMFQDFEAGRALELGGLVDAVIEIGRLVAVPTPVTEALGAITAGIVSLRGHPRKRSALIGNCK
jgi:2-dehydropantoate 2-reductase